MHIGQAALDDHGRMLPLTEVRLHLQTTESLRNVGLQGSPAAAVLRVFWARLEQRGHLHPQSPFRPANSDPRRGTPKGHRNPLLASAASIAARTRS